MESVGNDVRNLARFRRGKLQIENRLTDLQAQQQRVGFHRNDLNSATIVVIDALHFRRNRMCPEVAGSG